MEIAPSAAIRGGVGLSFLTDLRDPFVALGVAHLILGRIAASLLLDERQLADVGLHFFAARAEQQVH